MYKSKHLFIAFILLSLTACSHNAQQRVAGNPEYTEATAMGRFMSDPDHSMQLLDSAVMAGNLTPQRAEYLKAIVVADGYHDNETSKQMVQRLIDDEAWKALPDSDVAISFAVDLYRLMATITTTTGEYLQVLRYARQGAELAHGRDRLLGDEADCLSRLGYVQCQIGQSAEGLEALHAAQQLVERDDSWSSFVAYINTSKKLYYGYQGCGRYDEAKQTVRAAMSRLDALRSNIGQLQHPPTVMLTDSAALEDFIQFYQVQFYCYLANLYVSESKPDSAQHALQQMELLPQADDPSVTMSAIHPLVALGRYDEARQRIAALKEYMQNDTVNDSYLALLKEEKLLSACTGQEAMARMLGDRIIALTDSIHSQQQQMLLADAATQFQLQEERQHRVEAEGKLLITIIVAIVLFCLFAAITVALYVRRLMIRDKNLKQKYAKVKKRLSEIGQSVDEAESKPADLSPQEIYQRAVQIIEVEEQFKNPEFDVNTLLQQIHTNRSYLSSAINSQSGMTLRNWLAHCRVEHAKKLLLQNPNLTIEQVALECGYDNRVSLYRQFKVLEGVTPTEWLKSQENDNKN